MPKNTTLYSNKPKTFRRASSKFLGQWGSNLQNIEKGMRAIYLSDGYDESDQGLIERLLFWLKTGDLTVFSIEELETIRVLLQVDQSGAEALIVAYEAEFKEFRKLFIHGVKPHVYVALKLFKDAWKKKAKEASLAMGDSDIEELSNTPIDSLKKHPCWKDLDKLIKSSDNWPTTERYYYFAKQTCHSANYGIEANTFRLNILEKSGGKVVISSEDATYFLQTYRGLFPEIPDRNERIRQQVDRTKMLFNLFGHPYTITNYNITENTYKEYYAWPAQSTVAEITRTAFCLLQEYIEEHKKKWDLLSDCHDSYLVQCPLSEVRDCGNKMQEFMNQRLVSPVDGSVFNMRSELQVGFCWAPAKAEHPLGLQELKWL